MKKVGLVSAYDKINYGTVLQSYALQKALDNIGVENETILMSGLKKEIGRNRRNYYLQNLFNFELYKTKKGLIVHKAAQLLNPDFRKKTSLRQECFVKFIDENFHFSEALSSLQDFYEKSATYSSVIVGSDQLWLPVNIEGDYFTLSHVPDRVNKISFATSFGISELPKAQALKAAEFLPRINHISVREAAGQEIIKKLIGKDVPLVCDPTMLLTGEEWLHIQKFDPIISQKYIFCYLLGNNTIHRDFVHKIREKTGYSIVALQQLDDYIPADAAFADFSPYDIGPAEFLNLVRHAEIICTDSFHGTIFSLLYQKDFLTFNRFPNKNRLSTNSRIASILNKMGVEDRLFTGKEDVVDVEKIAINYDSIKDRMEEFRSESWQFLKDALGGA